MSMLWGNTAYCVKLSGEDLSSCSNKIESVGLRNKLMRIVAILLRKWCHNNKHFVRACPTSWRENTWRRYGMKKLRYCQCHPVIPAFAAYGAHL